MNYETYLAAKQRYEQAKAEKDACYKEMKQAEAELIDEMSKLGLQRIGTKEGKTVYISRRLKASAGGNMPGLIEALNNSGASDLVTETVNAQRLASFCKEYDYSGSTPPEDILGMIEHQWGTEVASHINLTEHFALGVRKEQK